jgi:predicted PurR-regulated permease PerM
VIWRQPPRTHPVPVEISLGQVARAVVVGLVLSGLASLLVRVQEVMLLLLLAILLATAIQPLVDRLRLGPLPHGASVLIAYTLLFAAIALPVYAFFPTLTAQAAIFTQAFPDRLQALTPYASALQPPFLADAAIGAIDRATNALRNPQAPAEEQIVEAGSTAAQLVFGFVTVFVLAYYWLVERLIIKQALMHLVGSRASDVDAIWDEVEVRIGGWVRGQVILMGAIGIMAGIGYAVIGLPNAALLGLFAGVVEAVPLIGPFLAFAPAVFVAIGIDPTRGLITVAYAAVIQQFEANILVPRVMGRSVGISPLTVFIGILVGSLLYGLPGTFVAVPIAATVQVILAHFSRVNTDRSD